MKHGFFIITWTIVHTLSITSHSVCAQLICSHKWLLLGHWSIKVIESHNMKFNDEEELEVSSLFNTLACASLCVPTFLGFVFLGLATLGSLETPPTRKSLAFITTYLLYIMWYITLHNGKHMCLWFTPSSNGLWEIIVLGGGGGGRRREGYVPLHM